MVIKLYQYLGETGIKLYDFLNDASLVLAYIFNLFALGYKGKTIGRCADYFINSTSKNKKEKSNILVFIFMTIEILIITYAQYNLGSMNGIFGQLVGTGVNYYGTLFVSPIFVAFSLEFSFKQVKIFKSISSILSPPFYPLLYKKYKKK